MAQPTQTASIAAPGFFGLNIQESAVSLSSGFALEANNCVVDRYGRIGARRGWTTLFWYVPNTTLTWKQMLL